MIKVTMMSCDIILTALVWTLRDDLHGVRLELPSESTHLVDAAGPGAVASDQLLPAFALQGYSRVR